MLKTSKQTWLIIIIYSFLLTSALLCSFYLFLNNATKESARVPTTLYYNDSTTISRIPSSQSDMNLYEFRSKENRQYISSTTLQTIYEESFFRYLPLLLIGICFCVILSSLGLWYILLRNEQKRRLAISIDLDHVAQETAFDPIEKDLHHNYLELKNKLDIYERDQERLHSYITHEQKNLIMLMKARMKAVNQEDIHNDMDKLTQSVDDVLMISSHRVVEKEVVDMALLSAEVCDLYHSAYHQISFHFDEDETYIIHAREHWIKRCLHNLIDNAIKYGNQGEIAIILSNKKGSVQCCVKDQGQGMDIIQLESIFDYRYRIHDLKKDGFGIGLSLVKHVCELCDGVIWVDSEPMKGSSFTMSFPSFTQP